MSHFPPSLPPPGDLSLDLPPLLSQEEEDDEAEEEEEAQAEEEDAGRSDKESSDGKSLSRGGILCFPYNPAAPQSCLQFMLCVSVPTPELAAS